MQYGELYPTVTSFSRSLQVLSCKIKDNLTVVHNILSFGWLILNNFTGLEEEPVRLRSL